MATANMTCDVVDRAIQVLHDHVQPYIEEVVMDFSPL